jgi:hypothetical protein
VIHPFLALVVFEQILPADFEIGRSEGGRLRDARDVRAIEMFVEFEGVRPDETAIFQVIELPAK